MYSKCELNAKIGSFEVSLKWPWYMLWNLRLRFFISGDIIQCLVKVTLLYWKCELDETSPTYFEAWPLTSSEMTLVQALRLKTYIYVIVGYQRILLLSLNDVLKMWIKRKNWVVWGQSEMTSVHALKLKT